MEQRVSRLEGAYEQVDRRLGAIETQIASLRTEFASLRSEMEARFERVDGKFTTMYGLIFGTWATTMLAIIFHH